MSPEDIERVIASLDQFDRRVMEVIADALEMGDAELIRFLRDGAFTDPDSAFKEFAKLDAKRALDEIAMERREYECERARVAARADMEGALSGRAANGYLAVIRALVYALADAHPEELKKGGVPYPGSSKATGDTGVVGFLKAKGYSDRSSRDLEEKIGAALKLR